MMGGKPPKELSKFYERNNLETPLSPEEEAAKKAEEEANAGKKGKKDAKKEKKGKGKGKKGDGDDDGDKQVAKIGPSEVVQKFDEFYSNYNDVWADRDETDNYEQSYDREMARQQVLPLVEKEKEKIVDALINQELKNMMTLAKIKMKKPKKPKKPKKKKPKKNKLPGASQIRDKDTYELLVELINNNIVKKLPPQKLTDFIGEFNYIHSMLDDTNFAPRDPSMALIRQLVTEYIIFPLGSTLVRNRIPEHVRAFLFYGPAGTGKTQVVRAIASETKSVVFDMSPQNIHGHFAASKAETDKMIAMVFVVAKEFEPSIVYIDEAEKVWPAKKKKKKGQKKPKKNDMS
jgi:IQ and AAA domain-containing protein